MRRMLQQARRWAVVWLASQSSDELSYDRLTFFRSWQ